MGLSLRASFAKNSIQAAIDIMEKENASLVDRPRTIAAGEIFSGDKRILLVGQGERWRKLRKYVGLELRLLLHAYLLRRALQSQLHVKVVDIYMPIQTANAKNVIIDILRSPEKHQDHTRRQAQVVLIV